MADAMDGTAAPEHIHNQLQTAADELEDMVAANEQLQQQFEANEWSGLDDLAQIRADLDGARDDLTEIARKVGLADQVRQAYEDNQMVGSKESLGRT